MKTVLIVDDEAPVREYFSSILEMLGVNVLKADDGDIAIEMLKGHPEIDLIVLDLKMKRLSGWEAYPILKDIKPDVKVLVSSGFIDADAVKKLKKMGVDSILSKPFPLLSFKAAVRDLLGL